MAGHNECINFALYARDAYGDFTTVFGAMYASIFFVGITGNICVILSVARNPALQSVRNLFIVSLSCSDIVVCLTSVPITPIAIVVKNWIFGVPMCYIFPLFQCMSILISTFTLMAIAVDRYILIIHPTKQPLQKRHAVAMIVGIWTCSYELKADVSNDTRYCGVFCGEDWSSNSGRMVYGSIVLILQFVIPLIVITFCYTRISLKVSNGLAVRRARESSSCFLSNSRFRKAIRRRQRTNRMLISMVVIFAVCWFLQVLSNVLRDFDALPYFIIMQPYFYALLFHCIAMTSTLWNPLLYAWLNETFRDTFFEILPCLKSVIRKADTVSEIEEEQMKLNQQ
ncbi:unnamed protein product [Soboliphyme baturini]|uniref:G_PROTEIN_RECEP_F1_2 domain-containing protein n=1 Tax=Soboliphyme baturini TaxID=241478 RepID=A0A183ILG4_9BILA|nr:unnamed protein product [Soboliphyme baturini]